MKKIVRIRRMWKSQGHETVWFGRRYEWRSPRWSPTFGIYKTERNRGLVIAMRRIVNLFELIVKGLSDLIGWTEDHVLR